MIKPRSQETTKLQWTNEEQDLILETERRPKKKMLLHNDKQQANRGQEQRIYLVQNEDLFPIDLHFKVTRDNHEPNWRKPKTHLKTRSFVWNSSKGCWEKISNPAQTEVTLEGMRRGRRFKEEEEANILRWAKRQTEGGQLQMVSQFGAGSGSQLV